LSVDVVARRLIQDPKPEPSIMRYELTDYEWTAIKPMLPNKPRGVPRANDRRVLNGIFWVLRSGAPWRDLPNAFGPYTTCYNRFVRWGRAGVWARIMNALAGAHDTAVQMIDTSIVRVHQHGACIMRNRQQSMGRSRGGLTSKIHAVVDTNGLPVRLALTAGEAHDNRLAGKLLSRLTSETMLLADRGYDADWIRVLAAKKGAWANIPPRCNRKEPICFSPYLYRARNWSNGSSTRLSTAVGSQRATISWRRTTSPSSSLLPSGYGCALMSPRPSNSPFRHIRHSVRLVPPGHVPMPGRQSLPIGQRPRLRTKLEHEV
jgi:transposase